MRQTLEEPLKVHGVRSRGERQERAGAILSEVGLPPQAMDRFPHEFSGGQRQRIGIARALVLDPKVLIADEPTAFLDSSIQAKVLKLLMNLQENRGLSMLFITHDIAVARKISDRIVVMQEGRIVEYGQTSRIMISPSCAYTQSLLNAAAGLESEMDTAYARMFSEKSDDVDS